MSGDGGRGAIDRRAFLRLGLRGRERVLELSCEQLYVRWVDARGDGSPPELAATDRQWEGEPPLDVIVPTRDGLLTELERRLEGVEVLRVTGREWLAAAELREAVETRIGAFRRRGGRVE